MNKKIASELAIGIILMIVVIIGGVFWLFSYKNEKFEKQENQVVMQDEIKSNSIKFIFYENTEYGIKFNYPGDITLKEIKSELVNSAIPFTVGGVYNNFNDGFNTPNFNLTVFEKNSGLKIMKSKTSDNNLFAQKEVDFKNGKFDLMDGKDDGLYTLNAYYEGVKYVYLFELTDKEYSNDMLDTFMKILLSADLNE